MAHCRAALGAGRHGGWSYALYAAIADTTTTPVTVSAHVLLYLRHYRGGVSEVVVKHLHETEGPVDHQGVTRRVLEALTPSRFPAVELRPDVLYVEDGNILTSAGLSAGIDLCLHLVRTDYGAATANSAARLVVAAPVRPGGQAQFIRTPLPPETGTSLAATRSWALGRLHEPLTRAALANHARTSIRT
ncbi:putative amidotransferase, partial [Nocardia amikacinitolerans]|nr:putative amidotransferase [Nocardia amikacinitolerans]